MAAARDPIPYDDTRADWGAAPPRDGGHTYVGPGAKVGVTEHWAGNPTGIREDDSHDRCLGLVRAWQDYHQNVHGWRDLGYHVLTCVHGRIIQGAAGGPYTSAAHALGHNTAWIGKQDMRGTGEESTPAMRDAGVTIYDALCADTGRKLTRNGHRDLVQTDCPGDELHRWWTATTLTGGTMALDADDKRWLAETIRTQSYRGVWRTDDMMTATEPDAANPYEWPETVLEDLAQRVLNLEANGLGVTDSDVTRIVDALAARFTVTGEVALAPKADTP